MRDRNRSATLIVLFLAAFLLIGAGIAAAGEKPKKEAAPEVEPPTQGTLRAKTAEGKTVECPLKHTSVSAEVSGFLAEVYVRQTFHNPLDEKIEAVYVFPLPQNSAVDEMVMIVGKRDIYGEIHKRREARRIYERARAAGKRTALLEQERPNIFTQSVANIQPGEEIIISIHYVQPLRYDAGTYRYHFPMVVGPRFIPGQPEKGGKKGTGWAGDTDRVPDASRITPPTMKPGVRNGHDISLSLRLDAGVPIESLQSKSHEVTIKRPSANRAQVKLEDSDTIPNKDFMLSYEVAGQKPRSALLTHRSQAGGFFMLMMQPSVEDVTKQYEARELFFVLDCSGSMSGEPMAKSKQAMVHAIRGIGPADTFQIIRFSSDASRFSPAPVRSTFANKREALDYVDGLRGSGGTRMIEGIRAALDYERDPERQRYVFFMTDGYIGNEKQILAAIKKKLKGARIFSFGIGSSTNRHLLEGMAKTGQGAAHFVRQDEDPKAVITGLYGRLSKPYLTGVALESDGVEIGEVYPTPLPDLLQAQPLLAFGTYTGHGPATLTLKGKLNGQPYSEKLEVKFPDWQEGNKALASTWARQKIQQMTFDQLGRRKDLSREITNLALDFHLMSAYTSFVAVDEQIPAGSDTTLPKTVAVPVPMPEGVSFEGVFGPPSRYPGEVVRKLERADAGEETEEAKAEVLSRELTGRGAVRSAPAPAAGLPAGPGKPMKQKRRARPQGSGAAGKRVVTSYAAAVTEETAREPSIPGVSGMDKETQGDLKKLADADEKLYRNFAGRYRHGNPDARNDALAKLLKSEDPGALTAALALCRRMAAQGQTLSKDNLRRLRKMLEAEDGNRRAAALQMLIMLEEEPGADLLARGAQEDGEATRLVTAYRLARNAELDAPEALARLLRDDHPGTLALAVRAAGQARRDADQVPVLRRILLERDPAQYGGAVLEAAIGLVKIAEEHDDLRPQIRRALLAALDREYPQRVRRPVLVACLRGLEGYGSEDALPKLQRLVDGGYSEPVRTVACRRALDCPGGALSVYRQIAAHPQNPPRPETLTAVLQEAWEAAHDSDTKEDDRRCAGTAMELLDSGHFDATEHGRVRVALVELALLDAGEQEVDKLIARMRTDREWRVRRAVVSGLARRGGAPLRRAARQAVRDPHMVVRQLGIAALAALQAPPERRKTHLDRLARIPKVSTCQSILRAEDLPRDLHLQGAEEIHAALR